MKNLVLLAALALACLGATPPPGQQKHPTTWGFYTVDNPAGASNVLTGIDDLNKVTGYYQTAGPSGLVLQKFGDSASGAYARWYNISYPGSTAAVVTSEVNNGFQAGYYETPNGHVAYFRLDPVFAKWWPQFQEYNSDPAPGRTFLGVGHLLCPSDKMPNCVGQQQFHNDPLFVGYSDTVNGPSAFEYDGTTAQTTTFVPPGSVNAAASGINEKGWICGWFTNASGVTEGWFFRDGIYWEYAYPGALATYPRGVNWQADIVGDYVDAAGATHGFIYSYPDKKSPVWQSIDEPSGTGTVIYGISDHDYYVGSYVDASGVTHGFLAIPTN